LPDESDEKTASKQERAALKMKNPRFLQTTKTMLASVAITGLMAGSAARLHASTNASGGPSQYNAAAKGQLADDTDAGKHDCKGQNSCKGAGGCKTGDAGCKGKNTCKGKGGCKTNGTT
jgi:hypothetical protein